MQGFLYARPMPIAQLLQWTAARGDVRGSNVPTWDETSPLLEV